MMHIEPVPKSFEASELEAKARADARAKVETERRQFAELAEFEMRDPLGIIALRHARDYFAYTTGQTEKFSLTLQSSIEANRFIHDLFAKEVGLQLALELAPGDDTVWVNGDRSIVREVEGAVNHIPETIRYRSHDNVVS